MIVPIILLLCILCVVSFFGGYYTGHFHAQRYREVIIREVPKVVVTEKVVTRERPVVVQVPMPKRQDAPGPFAMNQPTARFTDPQQQAQFTHTKQLLDNLGGPEA